MAATPRLDRWTVSDVSQAFGDGRLTVTFTVSGDGPQPPTACLRLLDAAGGEIYREELARLAPDDPGRPLSRAVAVGVAVWSQAVRMVLFLTPGSCEAAASAMVFHDLR